MYVTGIGSPTSFVGLQQSQITCEVYNAGAAGTSILSLYIDGYPAGSTNVSLDYDTYSNITWTIPGDWLPGGTHTIDCCTAYNCLDGTWSWTGTPDLQLTDIYTPSSTVGGQDSTLTAKITNIGNAGAGSYYVALYIDGSFVDEWSVSGGLPAQYYTEFGITLTGGLTAGTHSIEFYADHEADVSESNESNNYRTENFTWTGTPDLQLTDIYPPSSTTGGQDSTLTAKITNIGYADAGPFYVALYIDGSFVDEWLVSGGLPAQYYTEFGVTLTGGLTGGTHTIEFYADHENSVAESNESNNYRTENFTWTGTPDLQLTDIYPPSSTTGGQDSTLTAKITNIGYADAGPFYVALYIDGNFVDEWLVSGGLPAQYYTEFGVTLTGGLTGGAHTVEFYADHENSVAESNESNNYMTENFTWTGTPDLELTDIYTPTALNEGVDTTLTAKITNIGYADAGPFNIALVIDGTFVQSWQVTGLPAWYYFDLGVTITGGLSAGAHSIQFITDYYNSVTELNETNNSMTKSWTWAGALPPYGVTAVPGPGNGEVTVSWSNNSNPYASHYKIYTGTSSRNYSMVQDNVPLGWNTFPVSNLTNGVTYYFAVTSVNTSGLETGYSNEATAVPVQVGDSTPPSAPSNLNVVNPGNGSELMLNWGPSTDDTGIDFYLVYRLTNNSSVSGYNYDSGFPKFISSTAYTDSGLSDTKTYYYKVQAVDLSGNPSALSNLAYATPSDQVAPSAPSTVGISAENATVYLWWSMPATNTDGSTLIDLAGFNVYRGITSGSYGSSPINGSVPVTITGFMDQGVTNGQTYYYAIKAVDIEGNEGPYSIEVSGTPQTDVAPSAPVNLSITEKTSLDLAWDPNHESDIAGYNIYRGTSSGDHSTRMNGTPLSANWHSDTTAATGQTYYYVVTAVDSTGYESGFSNEVSGMIGQGQVEIISPTNENPLIFDFSGQNIDTSSAFNSHIYGVANGVIRYKFNLWERIASSVYLEIKNSETGEIVYTADEWKPFESDPYFTWLGKYKNTNQCVPDGWYDAKVYVNSMGVTYAETVRPKSIQITQCDGVWITDVHNEACDGLAAPYSCRDSFIAKTDVSGDIIKVTAKAKRGAMDLSGQITWTCADNPNDGIDSGECSSSTGSGKTFYVIPIPPDASQTGRDKPLAYLVTASVNGVTVSATKIIKQDKLDELRQEYEDFDRTDVATGITGAPARTAFDRDAAAYNALIGTASEPNRFTGESAWHILRNLNTFAINANTSYHQAPPEGGNISFASGFRTPIGNQYYVNQGTGGANSNHQYGRAFDFNQGGDSEMNYDAYYFTPNKGGDTYLAGSDGTYYFMDNRNGKGVPTWPAPSGVTYTRGHIAR